MKSSELREKYLSFFEAKGCKRWPSSSLVPDDPSMLLTSAGMVQFKPYFLQQKQLEPPFVGTTTVQKCVRTTDIDIIGTTGRHLSFFEMLGNFSFGAYFKSEMCAWAYEFSTEVLGFDPERLYFTVYLDDDETIGIWRSLGVPESHITRLGEKDNFWTAGPTGPCGPCSELYYDQGEDFGCGSPDCAPGCDCDRYLEYWNCVFTQFDRQEDGTLVPLPKKNIDTGMGLERTAAILQGVQSNYETDILRGLIAVGERLSGRCYGAAGGGVAAAGGGAAAGAGAGGAGGVGGAGADGGGKADLSLRICADHARAVTFMIADGILPSNEGRGFVLRRLLRRAVRHGQLLGIEPPFLGDYVAVVTDEMGVAYPELLENRELISRIVQAEEERFAQTLRQGQSYLDSHLDKLCGQGQGDGSSVMLGAGGADGAGAGGGLGADGGTVPVLSGAVAFELHDRYGFPIDLTVEIAAERGIGVDLRGFELKMDEQRSRARAAAKDDAWGSIGSVFSEILSEHGPTRFEGYDARELEATVLAIVVQQPQADAGSAGTAGVGQAAGTAGGGQDGYLLVDSISDGQEAQVILDKTPFYGEMGGQVGDTGLLRLAAPASQAAAAHASTAATGAAAAHASRSSAPASFTVEDTRVYDKAVYAHVGRAEGRLAVGDRVHAAIDGQRRERIERNHTATHLLHYALREILGDHVKQAGSLVAPERLRFDFTHFEALNYTQLKMIEALANRLIMEDASVSAYQTTLDEARKSGVTALFGEKYGDTVRVLQAGPASRELCGGTHVQHTAQIGLLKIVSETSVGANLRRIEAVTSFDALRHVDRMEEQLREVAGMLDAQPLELASKVEALMSQHRETVLELRRLRRQVAAGDIDELVKQACDVGGAAVAGVDAGAAVGVGGAADAASGVGDADGGTGSAGGAAGAGYRLLAARIDGQDVDALRGIWDQLRARFGEGAAVVIGTATPDGAPLLLAAGTPAAVAAGFNAVDIIRQVSPLIKGGGGGKPGMAQAGGKDVSGIDAALDKARELLGC